MRGDGRREPHSAPPFRQPRSARALVEGAAPFGVVEFQARRPFAPDRLLAALRQPWPGLVRGLGFMWIATRPQVMYLWSQVGRRGGLHPVSTWVAGRPSLAWPALSGAERAVLDQRWDPYWGDRLQDLLVVGTHVDPDAVGDRLEPCLLTDHEMARGEDAWVDMPDPLPPCPDRFPASGHPAARWRAE
jgi:G3E family GTPase